MTSELRIDRRREKLFPVQRWPTREEAAASRWFSPIHLGPLSLEQRTWVPAMVPWRATADGHVTAEVLAWYSRCAEGKPGAIVVEATGIRDIASGPLLRAGDDRFIDGLHRLADAVHDKSQGHTRVLIQLIDFLAIKRRPAKETFFLRYLPLEPRWRSGLPEPLRSLDDPGLRRHLLSLSDAELRGLLSPRDFEAYQFGLRERVTDTELEHIRDLPKLLPDLFARAARRCVKAGFDGIELHFAHAYTMASFLSALNTRDDGYGTTLEGRVRLPLEVYAAVRSELTASSAVGCRFLTDEIVAQGSRATDASHFGARFARAGMDFLSLSRGGKFEDARQPKVGQAAYPYTGLSGLECMPTTKMPAPGPFGRNLPDIAAVKRAVVAEGFSTPVVACGGIASFWQAEEVLARGDADIVASARQSLADPDWFLKMREGRGEQVRRCLFTNYCEGLDQSHQPVTCQTWDRERGFADDATVMRAHDGRRLVAPADGDGNARGET